MDRAFKRAEEAPRQALPYGDFDTTMDVVARAVSRSPFLLGDQFTAADLVIGSSLRWSTIFNLIPPRAEFTDYIAPLRRPPRAQTRDGEGRRTRQGATRLRPIRAAANQRSVLERRSA